MQAMDGTCKFNASNVGATIKSWTDVASGSEPDLQKVMMMKMMMMMMTLMIMMIMMIMVIIMNMVMMIDIYCQMQKYIHSYIWLKLVVKS